MDEPKDGFRPDVTGAGEAPWPTLPTARDGLDEREREALAEVEAGRYISNEAVMRWLRSIIDGAPIQRPKVGD